MAAIVLGVSVAYYIALRLAVNRLARGRIARRPRIPRGVLKKMLRVAAPMGVLMVGGFFFSYVQIPLVGFLLGPALVTGFYAAQRVGQTLVMAYSQIVLPQLPLFTQELAAKQREKAIRRMQRCITILLLVALLGNLLYALLMPAIAGFLTDSEHAVRLGWIALMAADFLIMAVASGMGQFVLASGINPFVISTLAAGILNVGFCFLLVPRLGIVGVPISTMTAGLLTNYWYNPYHAFKLIRRLKDTGSRMAL